MTTDAATSTKMMTLTPCTPPEAPLGRVVPLPLATPPICWGVLDFFLFSAGTERSTDAAPMRLAV